MWFGIEQQCAGFGFVITKELVEGGKTKVRILLKGTQNSGFPERKPYRSFQEEDLDCRKNAKEFVNKHKNTTSYCTLLNACIKLPCIEV